MRVMDIATELALDPVDSVPDEDLNDEGVHVDDLPDDRFNSRELSWLAFNERVLALAEDESQPLLERLKFLAIFASNLDEFYMVRIAGLKRRADMGLQVTSADGLSPREVLAALAKRTRELVDRHARCFQDSVRAGNGAGGHPHPLLGGPGRRGARPARGLLPVEG